MLFVAFDTKKEMQRAATVARRGFATASAGKESLWAVRELGPLGRALRDTPNQVPELQRKFRTAPGFTFQKAESDKIVMMSVYGFMGAATLVALNGKCSHARFCVQLVRGRHCGTCMGVDFAVVRRVLHIPIAYLQLSCRTRRHSVRQEQEDCISEDMAEGAAAPE